MSLGESAPVELRKSSHQLEINHSHLVSFVNGRDSQYVSLHHGQVFEGVTPLLLGFISRPQELDLPLLGFNLVLVLFEFLLGSDVRVSHRLEKRETHVKWFLKVLAMCVCLCAGAGILPAWLCAVCAPLASVKTPSGQQRKPGRTSPAQLVSSASLSAPVPGSSGWDLDIFPKVSPWDKYLPHLNNTVFQNQLP